MTKIGGETVGPPDSIGGLKGWGSEIKEYVGE